MVGKLSAKGDWELEGMEGNFKASYAAEGSTAVHQLMMDDNAESVESQPLHAWVLLSKPPAALPPAPAASTPAAADTPLALRGPADTSIVATPAASSSAAPALSERALGKRRVSHMAPPTVPTAPTASPPTAPPQLDWGSFSADQLAQVQVAIAHAMQQQRT